MTRRLRITLLSLTGLLLVLAATGLILVYVMLRPERFTAMLRDSARDAGMQLTLAAPARPSLWPRPGVRLQGLQLFVQGQSYPLLVADNGRIVVPWRTLLGGSTAITTLELDAPRLDLDQLRQAVAALPASQAAAPQLPRIDTGIRIHDGALVQGRTTLLRHVELRTGALMPDHPFGLDADAEDTSGRGQQLHLSFTPHRTPGQDIELAGLRLDVRSGKSASMQLAGRARWSGGGKGQLDLSGLAHAASSGNYALSLSMAPAPAPPGSLRLKLDGKAGKADLVVSPLQWSAWWRRIAGAYVPGALPPPPLVGTLDAERIDIGSLHISGLKLRSDGAAPASAGSTAAPATARSTP